MGACCPCFEQGTDKGEMKSTTADATQVAGAGVDGTQTRYGLAKFKVKMENTTKSMTKSFQKKKNGDSFRREDVERSDR